MRSSVRVLAFAAALTAVTVALGGCASPDEVAGGRPTPSAAPTPVDPSLDPSVKSPEGTPTTVTGVLSEGVEAGCVLLEAQGRTLLLLGLPRDSAAIGSRVQVRGRLIRDVATTCQQGIPLQVSSIRRLDP